MTAPLQLPGTPAAGWLVLIGGGDFSFRQTEELDRFLLEKMPAGNRRVAFIPTASGSPDYAQHFGSYLRTLDPSIDAANVPVYRARDLRRGKNLEAIRSAGMIYVGGGVTNLLAETLAGSPVEEAMREALERGAVVAGIGSGAACFGSWTEDAQRLGVPLRGFGWIPGAAVVAPLDINATDGLKRLVSHPAVSLGIGIPARSALAIAPDRSGTVLGEGQVAIVRRPA